jgi:hypothetical protein
MFNALFDAVEEDDDGLADDEVEFDDSKLDTLGAEE